MKDEPQRTEERVTVALAQDSVALEVAWLQGYRRGLQSVLLWVALGCIAYLVTRGDFLKEE